MKSTYAKQEQAPSWQMWSLPKINTAPSYINFNVKLFFKYPHQVNIETCLIWRKSSHRGTLVPTKKYEVIEYYKPVKIRKRMSIQYLPASSCPAFINNMAFISRQLQYWLIPSHIISRSNRRAKKCAPCVRLC